jgi:hypothetical protein
MDAATARGCRLGGAWLRFVKFVAFIFGELEMFGYSAREFFSQRIHLPPWYHSTKIQARNCISQLLPIFRTAGVKFETLLF